jgi:hypothetical protein
MTKLDEVDPLIAAIWQGKKREFAARLSFLRSDYVNSPYVLGLVYPGECVTCPTFDVRMDCISTDRREELETFQTQLRKTVFWIANNPSNVIIT